MSCTSVRSLDQISDALMMDFGEVWLDPKGPMGIYLSTPALFHIEVREEERSCLQIT